MASAPQPLESDPKVDFYVLLGVSFFYLSWYILQQERTTAESRRLSTACSSFSRSPEIIIVHTAVDRG